MRKKVILITGASGEVGQALVKHLSAEDNNEILTLDLRALPEDLRGLSTHVEGNLLDHILLARIVSQYEIDGHLPPRGAAFDQ